ncbi:MAG: hypothetical protein AAF939_08615 [Planctomycetota bacterium]
MKLIGTLIFGAVVGALTMIGNGSSNSHDPTIALSQPELGAVKWTRDLDVAAKKSARTGKPLFVQFQEVPG